LGMKCLPPQELLITLITVAIAQDTNQAESNQKPLTLLFQIC
jgi:hypothetical protein